MLPIAFVLLCMYERRAEGGGERGLFGLRRIENELLLYIACLRTVREYTQDIHGDVQMCCMFVIKYNDPRLHNAMRGMHLPCYSSFSGYGSPLPKRA